MVIFSVIYLPILSMVVGGVKALARSATEGTIHYFEETFMVIPVAEKITIELVMWGIPATIVLIMLLYGWLFGLSSPAGSTSSATCSGIHSCEWVISRYRVQMGSSQDSQRSTFDLGGLYRRRGSVGISVLGTHSCQYSPSSWRISVHQRQNRGTEDRAQGGFQKRGTSLIASRSHRQRVRKR